MISEMDVSGILDREIDELREAALFRTMPSISGKPGRLIWVDGRAAINFSSNNYLGMAGHSEVIRAAVDYTLKYGAGATASRLIAGSGEAHRELESFIAQWKGAEAALLFGSGYQANVGALTSLLDDRDLLISDQLNHASIIDGCRLSGANVKIYPHLDLNVLEDHLRLDGFRRKLVVTESVFSMDGDSAPLAEIVKLCEQWGSLLMVDEAHASGALGPQGQGLAAHLGVTPQIQMGTLGKAVGVAGAYIAGTKKLVEFLTNKARSLIFTTAAPPGLAGSALASLKIIASDEGKLKRERLTANARRFREDLSKALARPVTGSHIAPVIIGGSHKAMRVSEFCLEHGVFAHGIRYPTVPEGTARLRFTLMSDHTDEDISRAVSVMVDALEQ